MIELCWVGRIWPDTASLNPHHESQAEKNIYKHQWGPGRGKSLNENPAPILLLPPLIIPSFPSLAAFQCDSLLDAFHKAILHFDGRHVLLLLLLLLVFLEDSLSLLVAHLSYAVVHQFLVVQLRQPRGLALTGQHGAVAAREELFVRRLASKLQHGL